MDLDEYTSPNAVNFRNQFRQLSGYINSFIRTPLGDVGESEIQTFNLTTNMLRDNITDVERRLRLADVRFHHWVPTGILPSSINHLVSRLEQNIMVLCELADALVIDPPATQNEALAIEVGQTVMKRVMFFQYVVLSIRPHRFSPVDSLEAFLIFQEQRDISFIIKQNFDLFTSSILHEIQNLILNAIDKIELTLDHKNVRCRDHVRLGTPILDYEPTFRKLLKRLQNSIYVLCVLIEVSDLKQRPKSNEEEMNAITNGKKIIVELKKKINILILRSGGNKTLKIY